MFLDTIIVGPLQENSYVVACEDTKEAMIIDPGAEAARIYRVITFQGFTLKYVICTHGHIDHVGGVTDVLEKVKVPFMMHADDLFLIQRIDDEPLQIYLNARTPPHPDQFLRDGDLITVGKLTFRVLHTPGHTPGSICLLTGKTVFVGDTLFSNSIGRTDLSGGDHEKILSSIREKLLTLDDDVRVYAGHGNVTTIGNEKRFNPFV